MHLYHISYAFSTLENCACVSYMECMRTKTYMGTFPADSSALNDELYAKMLRIVREHSKLLTPFGKKLVLRKRYRGPRTQKSAFQRQSMCLKRNAIRFDAYVYCEHI